MNTLRIAGVALAIVASVVLVSGTLGVSSTTADRGVSVSVGEDQSALLGYDATDNSNVAANDTIDILTVSNHFGQPISVTDIELTSGQNISLNPKALPANIGPGENASVMASIDQCTSPTEEVSVTVTVSGDGVKVELSETAARSFEVSCAAEN